MAFLTDRTLATGVTFNDLIHIVITGDTSQNPAGSSYKATIGQVTNLVNSVVITGGTYDSSTGVITFTNSSGGTFTVTGFVSGFTDTYVSGGTYTAGTATFTNTTGGTFTVTGFTEPFSGGSGNCITDFYVTNIYGCSPITFKSESQFDGNTASGTLSFAQGLLNTASGNYSHSEGLLTVSSGNYSHSEGRSSSATTLYAHSEGTATLASGGGSHAEGNRTQSIGDNSHSEGSGTTATGDYSHSEGFATTSSGISSHSEGSGTTAIGNYSHSEGFGNQAIGIGSHAEGFGNIAVGNYQHVQGIYNATATTQNAFIIGNGKTNIDRTNLVLAASGFFNIYGNLNVIDGNIISSGSSEYISTTAFTTSAITLATKTLTYNGISYSGNVDVTILSASGVTGLKLIIKDEGGYAGTYRIRITPQTGLIDGNSYVDMNINYMSLTLVARNNNWWII